MLWLLKIGPFQTMNGCASWMKPLGIILGKTYRNTESVKSFIAAIADVEFLKVVKLIYNR